MTNNKSGKAVTRSFVNPDERREFKSHGHLDVLNLEADLVVGRAVFEPGWRWSNDVKPIAGTETCEAEHLGFCISGSMIVRMNDGEEIRIRAGDAFHLPPGHDAWVVGEERCEMLDFAGYREYARKSASKAA